MTLQAHLESRARFSQLSELKRLKMDQVVRELGSRIERFFSLEPGEHFLFGSAVRGTNLPRSLDPKSDLNYLVLFQNPLLAPNFYRDRLLGFVESELRVARIVELDHSVVLELQGFRVDLVPAIRDLRHEFLIPSSGPHAERAWCPVHERHLNIAELWEDTRCNNCLKPVIRLLKWWNVFAGYVYCPFQLETAITYQNHVGCKGLTDLFCCSVDQLSLPLNGEEWRRHALDRLKRIVAYAVRPERSSRCGRWSSVHDATLLAH